MRTTNTKSTAKGSQKAHRQPEELTPSQLASGLVISIGEARKILGTDAKQYTDDELTLHIFEMTQLAQYLLNTSNLLNKQL